MAHYEDEKKVKFAPIDYQQDMGNGLRTFKSGANRSSAEDKLDFEGFLSPFALTRFAEYMHKNRHMPDGSLRASDNWQLGIPIPEYIKSLLRHVMEAWRMHREFMGGTMVDPEARRMFEDALCAVMFNTQGILHELSKTKGSGCSPKPGDRVLND